MSCDLAQRIGCLEGRRECAGHAFKRSLRDEVELVGFGAFVVAFGAVADPQAQTLPRRANSSSVSASELIGPDDGREDSLAVHIPDKVTI